MSRREKKSNAGCVFGGITLLIILSIIAGGIWFTKKEYKSKQEAIASALSELQAFDEIETGKEIARESGFQYPVPNPKMTESEIAKKAKEDATNLTKTKYPASAFAKKQSDIFKKYRKAKNGERVSFLVSTTRKNIKGIYKGTFKDHKGRFIKVDFSEHRIPDILEDFHYLFIDGLATMKATEKKRELEVDFKKKKSEFYTVQKGLLTEKYYNESGYTNEDGVWIGNVDIFNAKLSDEENSFEEQLEKDENKIYQKNKLMGLFSVGLPEEKDVEEEEIIEEEGK
jgi:hypothetical protein